MNDKEISNIVKKSVQSPSDDFTNQVMGKIEYETVSVSKPRRIIILLTIGCVVCLVLVLLISLFDFSLPQYNLEISPLFIQIPGMFFIYYQVKQIRAFREELEQLRNLQA